MNRETMKSVILVILIAFSLLLTLALWNYQPDFDTAGEESEVGKTTLEESGGTQSTVLDLIEPTKIVFKHQGSYYSYADPSDRSAIYGRMKQWSLVNINDNPSSPQIGERDSVAEIIFPTKLPLKVLGDIFTINEDLPAEDTTFDRIFVVHDHNSGAVSPYTVYIMDTGEDVSPARMSASLSEEAASQLFSEIEVKDMVNQFRLSDWSGSTVDGASFDHIYLPSEEVSYPTEVLQTDAVPVKPLQNFLFPPTSTIKSSFTNSVDRRFQDISRRLDIMNDERLMKYVYMITNQSTYWTQYELLTKSVSDMNNHYGWTNQFRLENINSTADKVSFLMYFNGLPIYENTDLTKISLKYEGGSIQEYNRPLVSFFPVDYKNEGESSILLESGEEVISKIKEKGYDLNNIDDIQVGYSLKDQNDMRLAYNLLPQWYIKTAGEWKPLFKEDISQNKEVS
ncbi:YycH family regulatory protein [Halobacillus sp. BBL2006]|uniref:YycH family regulatory protein n=1 Tax=Halobacillus sp. BBL2006 TaxID=1543706 RepID=UPI0005433F8E|nr:two-component system activity regulator YycH [Halobacillus sp. BBL2006]KHE71881.1 hypothetical protein LD39_07465 [Halobacillus sp. BBL2006]